LPTVTYTQQSILRKLAGLKNSVRGLVVGPRWLNSLEATADFFSFFPMLAINLGSTCSLVDRDLLVGRSNFETSVFYKLDGFTFKDLAKLVNEETKFMKNQLRNILYADFSVFFFKRRRWWEAKKVRSYKCVLTSFLVFRLLTDNKRRRS